VPKCFLDLLNIIVSLYNVLLLTGLQRFDTLMNNAKKSYSACWNVSSNAFVKSLLVV